MTNHNETEEAREFAKGDWLYIVRDDDFPENVGIAVCVVGPSTAFLDTDYVVRPARPLRFMWGDGPDSGLTGEDFPTVNVAEWQLGRNPPA